LGSLCLFAVGIDRVWHAGVDLYTPVTLDYAKGKNKFTGKINKVTVDLMNITPADQASALSDHACGSYQTTALSSGEDKYYLHS
jgi:hypothetical protein